MHRPQSSTLNAAQQDYEWAQGVDRRLLFALLLLSVLGWAAFGWLTARPMHPLLALRTIIVGSCLAYLTAFCLAILLRSLLFLASARYRRAKDRARERRRPRKSWQRALRGP